MCQDDSEGNHSFSCFIRLGSDRNIREELPKPEIISNEYMFPCKSKDKKVAVLPIWIIKSHNSSVDHLLENCYCSTSKQIFF